MLDLQFICDHRDLVVDNCQKRGVEVNVDAVIRLRDERNALIAKGDDLRRQQKEVSAQIPKASADERPKLVEQGKQLRDQVGQTEELQKKIEEQLRDEQIRIPNMTHPEAPIGGEADAFELRVWGEKPKFDFKPKDHVEIAAHLDLIDFEAGARVAGSGFYFLKNDAVMLEMALVQYALTKLRGEGFTLFTTPDLARDTVLEGIGFNPRGNETQIYSVANSDLSLVATAEITLGGIQKDQTLDVSPVCRSSTPGCRIVFAPKQGLPVELVEAFTEFISSRKSKCSATPALIWQTRTLCTRTSCELRKKSFRDSASPTESSTPHQAILAVPRIASTTSKPGCPVEATAANTAKSPARRIARTIRLAV